MRAMVVEIGPEIEQLVFDKWMGQGNVGDGLDFYRLQYPQIGLPLVERIRFGAYADP
jgi:hypothetical protein